MDFTSCTVFKNCRVVLAINVKFRCCRLVEHFNIILIYEETGAYRESDGFGGHQHTLLSSYQIDKSMAIFIF